MTQTHPLGAPSLPPAAFCCQWLRDGQRLPHEYMSRPTVERKHLAAGAASSDVFSTK